MNKNGKGRTELLTKPETVPALRQESIILDASIENVLGEATRTSLEMLHEAKEAISDGAGEIDFSETATFIVEEGRQQLIIQRQVRVVKD